MYLQMVWMLTITSTAIEGFIAWYIPAWRKLTKRLGNLGKILDLAFSFFLSWALGVIFQAPSGLVIFMSAIASTIVSMPMYPALDWCEDHKVEIAENYMKARVIIRDTIIITYKLLRFLTFPLRMMRWCSQQYQAVKMAFNTTTP